MSNNKIKIVRSDNDKAELKRADETKKVYEHTEGKLRVAFSTLGCRVNHYETEAMAEKDFAAKADKINVINRIRL